MRHIMEDEFYNIDDCIEVYDDCVKISLPDLDSLILSDRDLDHIFYNSYLLYSVDIDRGRFFEELINYVFKVRKNKRDFYKKFGFKRF